MKKLVKFLPIAMGLITLTGCSSDDFRDAASAKMDLSNKYVLKVNVEEENAESGMRAYWDNSASPTHLTFGTDDILRVYDSKLQVYDDFRANNDKIFVIDADEANIEETKADGTLDYAYALHAEPGNISYASWNKGNVALLRINAEYTDYYQEAKSALDGETVVYKYAVPMWGYVTKSLVDAPQFNTEDAKASFETTLTWLTTRAKVQFNNGAESGVTAVRARSLKVNTNYTATGQGETLEDMKSAVTNLLVNYKDSQTKKTSEVLSEALYNKANNASYLVLNNEAPLSGWFEAVLDKKIFDTTDENYANRNQVRMLRKVDPNGPIAANYSPDVMVGIDSEKMEDYTNVVYLPIALLQDADAYEYLLFEYQTTDSEWHFLRLYDFATAIKLGAEGKTTAQGGMNRMGTIGNMTVTTELSCPATTLSEVNKYLANLKIDKDMIISFPNKVNSFKIGDSEGLLGSYEDSVLVIPAGWTKDYRVTLNFNGGKSDNQTDGTGLITTGGNLTNQTVKHKTTGKEYPNNTLTPAVMRINNASAAEVEINVYMGVGSARPVQVDVAVNNGVIALGQNVYGIKASAGTIIVDASTNTQTNSGYKVTVETEGTGTSVAVTGGTVNSLTHSGTGNITVENAGVTTLTNNGEGANITITKGNVYTLTNGENSGTITVTSLIGGNGQYWTDNSSADLTIDNAAGNNSIYSLTTASDNITLTGLLAEYQTLSGENVTVTATNSYAKSVKYTGTGTAKYITKGRSSVLEACEGTTKYGEVTGEHKLTFESEWDGKKDPIAYKSYYSKSVATNYDVYTAAELALLLNNASVSGLTVNLYANIDLGEENEWTGIEAFRNATGELAFKGNDHTIENVNLATPTATSDNKYSGFINKAGNGSATKFTASDLELTGVNTTNLKPTGEMLGIGGFIGGCFVTADIDNVSVSGSSIGGDYYTGETQLKSVNVGGLIGNLYDQKGNSISQANDAPASTVKNCTVNLTGTISGQWGLGGIIGRASGNGDSTESNDKSISLTLKNNGVKIEEFVTTLKAEASEGNNHFGRVGMMLGNICGAGKYTKLVIDTTAETGKTKNTVTDCINPTKLHFNKNIQVVPTTGNNFEIWRFEGYWGGNTMYVGYSPDFEELGDADQTSLTIPNLMGTDKHINELNVFTKDQQLSRKR